MIYTVANTMGRRKPIVILLDGEVVPKTIYLDRRRRIIRKFKTDEDGEVQINAARDGVDVEELKYSKRQKLEIVPLYGVLG